MGLALALDSSRSTVYMDRTNPKPFVFVLMPFKDEFKDVYHLAIRPACEAAGAYCERVDEQHFTENVIERIWNQIAKADIIISDMSEQNPNVFYETGYAHALGSRTILLTQSAADIPFDLRLRPFLIYKRTALTDLKSDLQEKVKYFVENPEARAALDIDSLEFYVEGTNIMTQPAIQLRVGTYPTRTGTTCVFTIGIYNKGKAPIDIRDVRFGLSWPTALGKLVQSSYEYSKMTEDTYLADISDAKTTLLPQAWLHKEVRIATDEVALRRAAHSCSVRAYTSVGMREQPFTILYRSS
jgi:hypothetical protein